MIVIAARNLRSEPLDAAAEFHAGVMPQVRAAIAAGELPATIAFDPADHTHTGWRLAAVQSLAREAAPGRLNAVSSADDVALSAALDYLASAPGVTGQYLPIDGQGAGNAAG